MAESELLEYLKLFRLIFLYLFELVRTILDQALKALGFFLYLYQNRDIPKAINSAIIAVAFGRTLYAMRCLSLTKDTFFRHENDMRCVRR